MTTDIKPKFDASNVKFALYPTKAQIDLFLVGFKMECNKDSDTRLSIDLETTGLDPHTDKITIVGMSYDDEYVLLCHPDELPDAFNEVCGSEQYRKVMHNAKFDMKFLMVHKGTTFKNVDDTYVMRRLLITGLDRPSTLAACVQEELGYTMSKEIRTEFIGNETITQDMAKYAAIDVASTWALYPELRAKIDSEQLDLCYDNIERPLTYVIAKMEVEGVDVDLEYLDQLNEMLEGKIEKFQAELDAILMANNLMPKRKRKLLVREKKERGLDPTADLYEEVPEQEFNVNSSKQVVQVLNAIGFTIKSGSKEVLEEPTYSEASMKAGMKLTGLETIEEQIAFGYDVISRLQDLRSARKASSGFVIPMSQTRFLNEKGEYEGHVNAKTGRVHCDFSQMGTDTGRFSCRQPNFQQMPSTRKDKIFEGLTFRRAFVAPDGHVMLNYDYQACELRILAEMTGDPNLIASMSAPDPHMANAAIMYQKPIDQVTKEERVDTKTSIFTSVYGGGAKRVAAILKKSIDHGKRVLDLLKAQFPGLTRFQNSAKAAALEKGYALSMSGRKRYFDVPTSPTYSANAFEYQDAVKRFRGTLASIERKGQNTPIQATNADITKLAMVWVDEALEPFGGQLLLTVHDELVAKVPEEHAEAAFKAMGEAMLAAEAEFLVKVPCKIDGKISTFWEH